MRISDWSSDVCSSDLLETRVLSAPVAGGERVVVLDRAGQETAAQGTVGNEADAQLAAGRQDLGLDVACLQRVLALQRRERRHGGRAAQGIGGGFGQAQRSEEPTSELQSLMRTADVVFS